MKLHGGPNLARGPEFHTHDIAYLCSDILTGRLVGGGGGRGRLLKVTHEAINV